MPEVKRVSGNDDGIITPAQGDIDTPTDGFAANSRLYLPPTAFNRFAVTREINDGLLTPRFAPSQRAWMLSGAWVPISPELDASTGRDADDRRCLAPRGGGGQAASSFCGSPIRPV